MLLRQCTGKRHGRHGAGQRERRHHHALSVLGKVIKPSAIGMSSCKGEFVLMMQVKTGLSINPSRVVPSEIASHF